MLTLLVFAGNGLWSLVELARNLVFAAMPLRFSHGSGKLTWHPPSVQTSRAAAPVSRSLGLRRSGNTNGHQAASSGAASGLGLPRSNFNTRLHAKNLVGENRRQRLGAKVKQTAFLHTLKQSRLVRQRYEGLHEKFVRFCQSKQLNHSTDMEADLALEQMLHAEYLKGEPASHGRQLLHGVARCKRLVTRNPCTLSRSKEALVGWSQQAPEYGRNPITWEAALLLAQAAMADNTLAAALVALAILVQFDAYLRPGELTALLPTQIIITPPGAVTPGPKVLIAVCPPPSAGSKVPGKKTKAGQHDETIVMGDLSSVSQGRSFVTEILREVALTRRTSSPDAPMFGVSLPQYERAVRNAVLKCGLDVKKHLPHCLRHGGPSCDFYAGKRTLQEIQKRGRWNAPTSVKRYEKSATYARERGLLTTTQLQLASRLHLTIASSLRLQLRLASPSSQAPKTRRRSVHCR